MLVSGLPNRAIGASNRENGRTDHFGGKGGAGRRIKELTKTLENRQQTFNLVDTQVRGNFGYVIIVVVVIIAVIVVIR